MGVNLPKRRSDPANGVRLQRLKRRPLFSVTLSRTIDDPLHSEDEDRYIIIGQSVQGRLIVVVHTIRGDKIRIISARVATPTEREEYEEGS
jgi:uncharacterized protein